MKKVYLVKLSLVETTMASWPVRSYYRGEEHSDDRFIIVFAKYDIYLKLKKLVTLLDFCLHNFLARNSNIINILSTINISRENYTDPILVVGF